MTPDQIFSIANLAAVACWFLLAVFPDRRRVTHGIAGTAMPALFAVAYVSIVVAVFPRADGSFSTLPGVAQLFTNPWLLLAGWLHYLAFDPVDRHVGGPRQRRTRCPALGAHPMPVPDLDVWAGWVAGLPGRAAARVDGMTRDHCQHCQHCQDCQHCQHCQH